MTASMKILLIGDFRHGHPGTLWSNLRKFSKGFQRLGHDVLEFSYPNMLLQFSPFQSRKLALKLARKRTDQALAQLTRHYQPDIIILMVYKLLDHQTVEMLRAEAPHAVFLFRYSDALHCHDEQVMPIGRLCDWFIPSGAGEDLIKYQQAGLKRIAFLPNPCDPDTEHPAPVDSQWQSNLLFVGKLSHHLIGQDTMRPELIHQLVEKHNMTVWGCLSRPGLVGKEYFDAIRGAKMALSINAFNTISKYHSDRLTHLLACGAFTLARHVPNTECLFRDQEHLCYFHTIEQCLELAERFSKDESARKTIARAGMEHCHREFNGRRLAQYLIELATQGEFKADWAEFLT